MMASLETKPEVNGKPVSDSVPISIMATVKGSTLRKPPMRRMSCS